MEAVVSTQPSDLRIPEAMRERAGTIIALTDAFCAAHLDAECAELSRKMVAKLARKRPSPLARGDERVWAGAVLWALGQVNFLFDKTQTPHLSTDDLVAAFGAAKSTLGNKAKQIRDALKIRMMDLEFSRRELLERSSLPWMIMVNGMIVDARTMPPEIQEEARRHGFIPDLAPR